MNAPATILIADDSAVVRAVVRDGLEAEGYLVHEVDGGEAAVAACRELRPDAVLLDIEMPGVDGREVLLRIKRDRELSDIPVVFLTGRTGTDDLVAGLRAGAHDYLKKPFEQAELLARIGSAVRNKHLQDELRNRNELLDRMARVDALTELYNRRHLQEELHRLGTVSRRENTPLAVVLFDVDHFKHVNDTLGHQGGDLVLQHCARRLLDATRAGDVLGRWGGEEFLLILPNSDLDEAAQAAERMRLSVAEVPITVEHTELTVTLSGGCAADAMGDVDALLVRADAACYRSKAAGRNQISTSRKERETMPDVVTQTRSQALQSVDVVDTPPEERFDRVVRLAQRIFRVPMVGASFVDGDRYWLKAHVGLEGTAVTSGDAFCEETIRQPGTMVVRDAAADDRFAANPFVTGDAHIRFFAGHPVRAPGGQRVGALYIIDDSPRDLSDEQAGLLAELAGWIESELTLRDELARAEGVQHGLLPHLPPSIPGFTVAGCCIPTSEVGGDFFDWFPVGDEFQFTIADVMGKGLGAAIIAASVRAVLRTTLRAPPRRGDVERRRPLLIADAVTIAAQGMELDLQETSSFVTLFTARLDVAAATLHYVDAGHGLTAVVGTAGDPRRLWSTDLPIGVTPGDTWTEQQVQLQPGDTLISVSDGVLDFFSSALDVLDAAAVVTRGAETAQQVIDGVERFARARRIKDDITALVVRRDGP